jgi:hypothetical protein
MLVVTCARPLTVKYMERKNEMDRFDSILQLISLAWKVRQAPYSSPPTLWDSVMLSRTDSCLLIARPDLYKLAHIQCRSTSKPTSHLLEETPRTSLFVDM